MSKDDRLLHAKALPPFAALRAFEAVFRLGGIRKAAASMNINHAVVSRHMKLLEDWLGTPIMTRDGGKLALTEDGARFHARVSSALSDLAHATHELVDARASNHLRIWCVPGFAVQWLSGELADFEREHPEYTIELKPTDEPADLLAHQADVDIHYYGDDWGPQPGGKGVRFIELARPEMMAVAAPDVAARLNTAPVSELASAPLLHEESQDQWRAWLAHNGVAAAKTLPGPLFWHAHLCIAAAKRGRGVAIANAYHVAKDLAHGELVEVKPRGGGAVVLGSYILTAREDRWTHPALTSLRRFLVVRTKQYLAGA